MREQKPRYDFDVFDLAAAAAGPVHTDIPRLRAGGLGGQFWSVYVPATLHGRGTPCTATLEQIDVVHRCCGATPTPSSWRARPTTSSAISKAGRIASLIGMEGGHSIDNSLGALRHVLRGWASRYMTLTHNDEHRRGPTRRPTRRSTAA